MTTENLPAIRISRRDFARLDHLLATCGGGKLSKGADLLLRELSRATVMDNAEIPSDTVTMHTQVLFRDEASRRERTVTLVYPSERSSGEDTLSVLTPLGAALIGLSEGQTIEFEGLDGDVRRITVLKVFHRPDEERG